ncbi:MAG TPA: 50S ribosomal protein L3 N(5)-glutamine methyltransferase [Burkholderiaceae bacterium]|nr:50S ribosomal protein L3 N(5)-glutamine methyltransferase [Burkholderiaceae bacterium]
MTSIDAKANLRTLRDVVRYAVSRFNEAGVFFGHGQIDAFDEAVFIVMRSLHLPLERLETFLDSFLTHAEINSLLELIDRRAKRRIPAAYLVKEAWLQGYRFYVDNRAIIPRSFIAELLKDELAPWIDDVNNVREVLDLCTGSGCLAIMAADTFPYASVDAVDISKDALAVAAQNVEEYRMGGRVRLVESDLFSALDDKRYDLILCNPPYVTETAMAKLPKEYTHEPKLALAGGIDGMDVVRYVMSDAAKHLKPDGMLVVEVGDGRAMVEQLYPKVPMNWLTTSAGDDMVFLVRGENLP